MHRYYVAEPVVGQQAKLVDAEAHHLLHVLRARRGTEVILFDGSGWEFPARVQRTDRNAVELDVLDRRQVDRELPFQLTLGAALPKGDRQRWLVEKAVELGVSRIVPLRTQRAVAQPVDQAVVRLRRAVIEASKQCGRNRLLEICPPADWVDFVAAADGNALRLVAHPGASVSIAELVGQSTDETIVAIGPEGGLNEDEVLTATRNGWQAVGLGPRILRVETAALALAAYLTTACG